MLGKASLLPELEIETGTPGSGMLPISLSLYLSKDTL